MLQNIREKLQGWLAFAVLAGYRRAAGADVRQQRFHGDPVRASRPGSTVRIFPRLISSASIQNRLITEQQAAKGELSPEAQDQLKRQTLDGLVLNRAVTQYLRDTGFRVQRLPRDRYVRSMAVFQVGRAVFQTGLRRHAGLPGDHLRLPSSRNSSPCWLSASCRTAWWKVRFLRPAEFRRLIAAGSGAPGRRLRAVRSPGARRGNSKSAMPISSPTTPPTPASSSPPESANLEYVEVALADLAQDYTPDEEALRKAYDADPTRFRIGGGAPGAPHPHRGGCEPQRCRGAGAG